MKRIVIAVIAVATLGGCGGAFANDVPQDNSKWSCDWTAAVLSVDALMDSDHGLAAATYADLVDNGEKAARKEFLVNNFSGMDETCSDFIWSWVMNAYMKFEGPGHVPMDSDWLNG